MLDKYSLYMALTFAPGELAITGDKNIFAMILGQTERRNLVVELFFFPLFLLLLRMRLNFSATLLLILHALFDQSQQQLLESI